MDYFHKEVCSYIKTYSVDVLIHFFSIRYNRVSGYIHILKEKYMVSPWKLSKSERCLSPCNDTGETVPPVSGKETERRF